MKEFLKTNTVTYNLMSFTGFKSILLFSLLTTGPKSYEELQESFRTHEYLHENISKDTLRIYINSLKEIGCDIKRIHKDGVTKYSISSHPFNLKIDDKQIKSIINIYKGLSKSIDVSDLKTLQKFFNNISPYITNEKLKEKLQELSPLNNIDPQLVDDLLNYTQNNTEIIIYYKSPTSGKKNITVLADKLEIHNRKLYLYGFNSEYNNYSSFLVSKIIKIVSINLHNKTLDVPEITVGYEYTQDKNEKLELLNCEKIISQNDNKITIELTSKNKFEIIQRILFLSNKCKVLYPENIKTEVIANLKKMKEGYFEK